MKHPAGMQPNPPLEPCEKRLCDVLKSNSVIDFDVFFFKQEHETDDHSNADHFTRDTIKGLCAKIKTTRVARSRKSGADGKEAPTLDAIHVSQWVSFAENAPDSKGAFEKAIDVTSD